MKSKITIEIEINELISVEDVKELEKMVTDSILNGLHNVKECNCQIDENGEWTTDCNSDKCMEAKEDFDKN